MNTDACPFCGKEEITFGRKPKDEIAFALCSNCMARGPSVYEKTDSNEKAIFSWRERKHSLTLEFAELRKKEQEATIRLYGVLWLLVEHEIISEGRARELGNMPLHKMIDKCMEYRITTEIEM